MGSKYQFRERGKDYSFENKNVFINHCQHKYQKSLHFSNPSEYYSYDFGETWNLISDFKSERQTIQNEKKPQEENRNHSTKSESKSGWGTYLIYVLAIWGGLSLINNKVTPIGFVNKINTELFGSSSNSTNKNNQEVVPNNQNNNSSDGSSENANPEQDFPITSDAEELFIDNAIFKIIKIDNDTKNTLLQILSDPNPDPDKIENQSCDNTNTRCIYCNNKVPGVNYSYQKYLYQLLSCGPNTLALYDYCLCARMAISSGDIEKSSAQNNESKGYDENDWEKIDWAKVMSSQYKEKVFELEPIIAEVCSNYRNGVKYVCVENPVTSHSKNFCSEKCKTEYKSSH